MSANFLPNLTIPAITSGEITPIIPYVVKASDVIEIWEAKAYLSMEIPEYSEDNMSFDQLKNIVLELQQEVIKMKG
mgnify:CR=1 FL=1